MQTQQFKKARMFVLVNVVVLFFLLIAFGREYIGNLQVQYEIKQQEQQVAALEQKKLETQNLIESLSSEYHLEREGRIKHGLGKEGEKLVVVDLKGSGDTLADAPFGITDPLLVSNPKRWFYYFFDKEPFDYLSSL